MLSEDKKKRAIEIIGSNIEVYNHFECYSIPDKDGKGVICENKVTLEEFLELIYDYYHSKRINYDYYTDSELKDCQSKKSFIKKRITESSYRIGLEWVNSHVFKEI